MSIIEEVERLKRIPLFANVDASKLKLLAFASERMTFPAKTELFHQGDTADAAYLIMEGSADVLIQLPDGELPVAKLGKDELVGEIGIICDVPRTATVRSESELVTLKITKELFFQMVQDFPAMGIEVMRELAIRLNHTNNQLSACRDRVRQLEAAH
jgi:CRP/FNR family transcriptional regulator, cyclic AMP receptor protein